MLIGKQLAGEHRSLGADHHPSRTHLSGCRAEVAGVTDRHSANVHSSKLLIDEQMRRSTLIKLARRSERLFHTRATAYSEDLGTLSNQRKLAFGEQRREIFEAYNLRGGSAGSLPPSVSVSSRPLPPAQTQSRPPQSSAPTGSSALFSQSSSSPVRTQLQSPVSGAYQQPVQTAYLAGGQSWPATSTHGTSSLQHAETAAPRPDSFAQQPLQSSPTNVENLEAAYATSHGFVTTSAAAAQPALQEHAQQDEADSGSDSTLSSEEPHGANGSSNGAVYIPEYTAAEASQPPPDVYVVTTAAQAERISSLLCMQYRDRVFAVDTETKNFDIARQSPRGHGEVICFSVYGGPDLDFREMPKGRQKDRQNQLWVDTMVEDEAENAAIFAAFEPFFTSPDIKKVWHNYSFDRHVFTNCGICCKGFHGDTMHMARLWNSSRKGKSNYSLESLSGDAELKPKGKQNLDRGKTSMKKLFGRPNIKKDGTEGKISVLPPMEDLQRDPDRRADWIDYSAYDAKATWTLYKALEDKLRGMTCEMDPQIRQPDPSYTLWSMYVDYWKPFGELLTDMEDEGFFVNRPHLAEAEKKARQDQTEARDCFRNWAAARVEGARHMNVSSGAQVQQLLFAGVPNQQPDKGKLEQKRIFKMPNLEGYIEPGKKAPKKNIDVTLHGLWGEDNASPLAPTVYTAGGWPAVSTPVLRLYAGKPGAAKKALIELEGRSAEDVRPLADDSDEDALWPEEEEAIQNVQQTSVGADKDKHRTSGIWGKLEQEAKAKGWGKFYTHFYPDPAMPPKMTQRERHKVALEACQAVDALCEVGAIDTLLSNFIEPLQDEAIATKLPDGSLHRVHCSLNINTETGRLSARRPNLQNQPAHEKDRYKVRQAFTAEPGNTLVVADYGQLELRVLAHMAGCLSMKEAFKLGGDFHSRTALGMYDHIQEAIAKGECILEWDPNKDDGPCPAPLLKDAFGGERRKAKVLNFSIAYGKTAHGLSKDWGTSLAEAEQTVKRWYDSRPEVLDWQKQQQEKAKREGYVCTIMGRRRQLPDARKSGPARGHALRAAINTPVQGSAADIATAAMLAISRNLRLKELGWKLLLQVHDEVIVEGPKESVAEAQEIVVDCMQRPFYINAFREPYATLAEDQAARHNPLDVDLVVDADNADTWYEAK